jgi:putative peptide zinc metalloprotease protein
MDQMLDESAELANLRLKLRSDLDFDFQEQGKDGCYVVLDETSSGYFQIGIPEYALLSMMDGGTTLQEAVQETSHRLGDEALTVRDAVRITHWALESGLASVVGDDGVVINNSNRWLEKDESIAKQSIVSRLNPLFIRVPLGNPARLIAAVATPLGWLCSKSFLLVWLAVVGLAFFQLLQHSAAILTASSQILVADSWLWMLVTLGVLKVIHELAHGLFCHRFGGRTKEVGLVFILFIPMPYVDVTSCWGFDSKWKRIAVASAGMYAEILLAAIATLVWSYSSDPVIRFHMMNVMILGSLTTLFFNANFLMRFDGYYVLSDLVEIPNLYQKGQQFVHGLGKRWILGLHRANEDGSVSQRVTIQAYGLAAFVWRILICVSLTILAAAMFYGFGIVLAVISAAMWLGMPTFQFFKNWRDPATGNSVDPKWISCVTAPLIACLVAAMVYLPWPAYSSAPALVEYDAPANVRCEAAGFIQRVHVVAGQQVRQGDLLVELENHELKLQLEKLTLDIDKSVLRSRTFLPDRDIVAYQSEQLLRETLEQQQAELQQKLSTLKLLAATDGKIVGVDLESLPGQFVTSGTSLMKIVDESNKKITLSIGQQDFDTFSMNDQQLAVFAPRHGWVRHAGILNSVKPTATTTVDGRLASFSGGQLPVRQTESTAKTPAAENPFELVAARFNGELSIDVDTAKSLKAGVTGQVRLNDFSETIGEHLVVATRQWLKSHSDALRN